MPATYEPIATNTLSSATASITFSSIASTYTDLKLIIVGTVSANGNTMWLRFNSDTATNYSSTYMRGNITTAAAGRTSTSDKLFIGDGAIYGASSAVPGFWSVDIFSYAGSTNKSMLITESMDKENDGGIQATVGLWSNTAAITSITISSTATNLNSGTTATLYGILKA